MTGVSVLKEYITSALEAEADVEPGTCRDTGSGAGICFGFSFCVGGDGNVCSGAGVDVDGIVCSGVGVCVHGNVCSGVGGDVCAVVVDIGAANAGTGVTDGIDNTDACAGISVRAGFSAGTGFKGGDSLLAGTSADTDSESVGAACSPGKTKTT
ncbi:MAG: hypothetical protein GX045_04325, partial [Clostridiaceae bacterium]|nr:hypothetical protein [Clostridiaceae bacterium]